MNERMVSACHKAIDYWTKGWHVYTDDHCRLCGLVFRESRLRGFFEDEYTVGALFAMKAYPPCFLNWPDHAFWFRREVDLTQRTIWAGDEAGNVVLLYSPVQHPQSTSWQDCSSSELRG